MFRASKASEYIEDTQNNNFIKLYPYDTIQTQKGPICAKDLSLDDVLIDEENIKFPIINIIKEWDKIAIFFGGEL